MLKPEKISERLENSIRSIRPTTDPVLRIWHFLHGPIIMSLITYLISLSSVWSLTHYRNEIGETERKASLFFSIMFFGFGETIFMWSTRRAEVADLSESLIKAAKALEDRCTQKQLLRMSKMTFLTRYIAIYYWCDVSLCTILYVTYPIRNAHLAAAMPFLPDVLFPAMAFLQGYIEIAGSIALGVMFIYHAEVSLLLKSLCGTLSEHFDSVGTREELKKLVEIHQGLLGAASKFRYLFSRSMFNFSFLLLTILICNTYVILTGTVEPVFGLLVVSVLPVLFAPCLLSELVSISFESIGRAAYCNDWVGKSCDIQKDLSLVILRSQKQFYVRAGLLGELNMQKYSELMQRWYSFVQAVSRLNK